MTDRMSRWSKEASALDGFMQGPISSVPQTDMFRIGHYGVALLVYTPLGVHIAVTLSEFVAIVGAVVCVALTMLPDVDQRLPGIAHRGPTHSIAFALAVGFGLAGVVRIGIETIVPTIPPEVVTVAFAVGCCAIGSHLLADALTPRGVRPFWPIWNRTVSVHLTRASNPIANYLLFGLGIVVAITALHAVIGV